ncbi:MAG TPA: ATP-dependent DNA helicase, partial [Verrucomicrobiae bacterium]|nr:ATP-dependent DNA helicase [Verrucomicrobiae bacterium]
WVTADSFEGLRALLVPPEKRAAFAETTRRRHHRPVTSLEFAGRWSLLRPWDETGSGGPEPAAREEAVERFALALLRRYGVVFRRLLDCEAAKVSWYELGRVYRRLEARGEIRGGYFVAGVSGEQFALPEAIGMLRSLRKTAAPNSLITISGADPLNLTGTLMLGPRVAAVGTNRILLRDGVPVASLEAGHVRWLTAEQGEPDSGTERLLRVGTLPAALRPYYSA